MKIILLIIGILCLSSINSRKSNKHSKGISMFVDTDYRPLHKAYQRVKLISQDYSTFKEQVVKNTTIEYQKCVDIVEGQQCKYYDEWIYRIDLLKIENMKSNEIEIPFLMEKKHEKVERLKVLLKRSENFDKKLLKMKEQLQANQEELLEDSRQIKAMYKLPDEKPQTQLLIQKEDEDNNETPDVAKQQLQQAREQYEIADQSIQAQTAKNVLNSDAQKLTETISQLEKSFKLKSDQMNKEKHQLKEDILRLRALLENEQALQQKNNATILILQEKVDNCEGKPTNLKKDCDPIFLHAKKYQTEAEIVGSRNNFLFKELDLLAWENNYNPAEQVLHNDQVENQEADEFKLLAEEESANNETEVVIHEHQPKERNPIKHLEPLNNEEEAENETEETNETEIIETNETEIIDTNETMEPDDLNMTADSNF